MQIMLHIRIIHLYAVYIVKKSHFTFSGEGFCDMIKVE